MSCTWSLPSDGSEPPASNPWCREIYHFQGFGPGLVDMDSLAGRHLCGKCIASKAVCPQLQCRQRLHCWGFLWWSSWWSEWHVDQGSRRQRMKARKSDARRRRRKSLHFCYKSWVIQKQNMAKPKQNMYKHKPSFIYLVYENRKIQRLARCRSRETFHMSPVQEA